MKKRFLLAALAAAAALVAVFASCSTVPDKYPIEPGTPAAAYVASRKTRRALPCR